MTNIALHYLLRRAPPVERAAVGENQQTANIEHLLLKPFNGPLFSHMERIVQIEHAVWDTTRQLT